MIKFDEKLCLDQLLKELAYQKLYISFLERYAKIKAEIPYRRSVLFALDEAYSELVKEYKSITCKNDKGGLIDSFGLLVSESCSEYVLIYLKQARDTLEIEINRLNRPAKGMLKKTLKNLVIDECRLDFTKIPEED